MGISGLLPLLKSIQRQRHLSEFAGQTVAVDAYVWLHRGAYGCASELALGKPTHRYVDYAMHRVRMLRHYGITPYIVFDGGPLPAKQGTEESRAAKRTENLARGKALAAQGRHSQAREFFCKCVDVTPQMAFQLIKGLRAENVQYVVAPYEADAQMAFLEATGVVQAILTEDSDLLVFGARTLLLKLDVPSASVTSVSHSDLGAVLPGWTHTQFRDMAILSGCDYLPSIQGVGLKTARTWLSTYGTVEKALSVARLAGKTRVPSGYLEQFRRAEAVFLYQRVFDLSSGEMVNLTPPPTGNIFDVDTDAYIGRKLDAELAGRIARGDTCPISLRAMFDINPGFVPRAIGVPKPLAITNMNKGKAPVRPAGEIVKFFAPIAAPTRSKPVVSAVTVEPGPPRLPTTTAGTRSGKRTLASVHDDDAAARADTAKRSKPTHSRFFTAASTTRARTPVSPGKAEKENTPLRWRTSPDPDGVLLTLEDDDDVDDASALSVLPALSRSPRSLPTPEPTQAEDPWGSLPESARRVTQEDGYLSPSPVRSDEEGDEMSSPARSRIHDFVADGKPDEEEGEDQDDGWITTIDVPSFRYQPPARRKSSQEDVVSSPPRQRTPPLSKGAVLVPASPAPGDAVSDIEDADDEGGAVEHGHVLYAPDDEDLPFADPDSQPYRDLEDGPIDDPFLVSTPDPDSIEAGRARAKVVVAHGWFEKFSRRPDPRPLPLLRRQSSMRSRIGRA